MAQLFRGGHGTPYFTVDYGMPLFCLFAIPSYDANFFQVVVFLVLEPLGADFELPSGPCHLRKPSFYNGKNIFLIKRRFGCKIALESALGPSWARFWSPWARMGCSCGAFNASRWQLRFLKIPPNVHNNNFTSQPWIFQQSNFSRRKIRVF